MIIIEDFLFSLEVILNYLIFNSENELLFQFDVILGKKGIRVFIWNIRRYSMLRAMDFNKYRQYGKVYFSKFFQRSRVDIF